MAEDSVPIACTLTTKEAASQLDEWGVLRRSAKAVAAVEGGCRLTFPASSEATVRDLAAREANCCAFLDIVVDRVDDDVVLTVTGPADAAPVIGLIVGG